MMLLLHALAERLAPWQTLYGNSKVISGTITTVHLVSLLFSGGLAVAADRTTLRVSKADDRARQLGELRAVHTPVLIALLVLCASGVLLAAADVDTYLRSPLFALKLGLVALLVANGASLMRAEGTLRRAVASGEPASDRQWRRLRRGAVLSVALWTATLIAGAVLVDAA